MTRRVLMITPHFPPDSSAASHRVRLLAPHLESAGWRPTVLTLTPDAYEGTLDPALARTVPASLDVVRCRAWSAAVTRRFGVGDLGLRSFGALRRGAIALLERERYDVVYVTIYPTYPALLGPLLKRRFPVRFVLDYQDPWIGSWGLTVGGGPQAALDFKSRASRLVASWLEPIAVRAADAITAVSERTYQDVLARVPASPACAALPLGWECTDAELASTPNPFFDASDRRVNLCYVGTLLPNGFATLNALLEALRLLRDRRPSQFDRVRLWFIGTSNQWRSDGELRVRPRADALGLGDAVQEVAPRIGYAEALTVLRQSSGILMLGSSERHYTASKLYPALLARHPIFALFHADSTVVDILRRAMAPPSAGIVTYCDTDPGVAPAVETVHTSLCAWLDRLDDTVRVDFAAIEDVSARALAHKLAAVMDQIGVN